MSVVMPMYRKKTGINIWPREATSRSTRSLVLMRRSASPATKAPIIGARCALSASTENASATPIAETETVAVERLNLLINEKILGNVAKPTIEVRSKNPTASPMVVAMVEMPTDPCSTMRVTTVRMMSPSTSSTTAAPSTVRASTVASARKSPNTRAVIPILVAVSAAPINNAVFVDSPIANPAPMPRAIGKTTPIMATSIDARPTLLSSATSVSSPTWINRKITPNSASTNNMSLPDTRPSTDGPMMIPAAISPITAGTWIRSEISAAILATIKMMVRSSKTRPRSTPSRAAETIANMGFRLEDVCIGTVNFAHL